MGIMEYSLLWVMQGLDHQPYQSFRAIGLSNPVILRSSVYEPFTLVHT